ncbi:MAG TPA: tRNA pseudouridine(55) synthase TruB [Ghiorsea sp.]|nr:tRNA pseudouridine(55) synthase TruB [Ghiorsea sp.]
MSKSAHPCGVLFLDKPKGWTSRKAVNHVIHLFSKPEQKNRKQRPKAGHTGTLDPLATGMLPILLGDATRFSNMGLSAEKSYEVSFDLSFQTDTLDLEGEVLSRFEHAEVNKAALTEVLAKFMGKIQQVPPIYSAIRVDGQRAHKMARQGQDVQMQAREVEIIAIELLSLQGSEVTLAVDCSKGTYIRSLARDIGEQLGLGGCVTALRRTSSGGWAKEMMVSIEELEEKKENCMLPLQIWLRDLPVISLAKDEAQRFVQGQRLLVASYVAGDALCCIMFNDLVLGTAMFNPNKGVLQPERVLPTAQEILK